MTLISIQERSQGPDGFQVALSFDRGPEYHVPVRDPFAEKEEEQLEWYFEQYLRFPFLRQVQARSAKESITTYGEAAADSTRGTGDDDAAVTKLHGAECGWARTSRCGGYAGRLVETSKPPPSQVTVRGMRTKQWLSE